MLLHWYWRRGCGECKRTPDVLIWLKSRQNPWKSGQNLWKPSLNPENLNKPLKIWPKMAPKITWSFFLEVSLLWSFFRASFGESGQKSFAPLKICLLRNFWYCSSDFWNCLCESLVQKRTVMRLDDISILTTEYYWNRPPNLTGWIRPCFGCPGPSPCSPLLCTPLPKCKAPLL